MADRRIRVAAGAMLSVISHETVPETHRNSHRNSRRDSRRDRATVGPDFRLILEMFLNVTTG